MSITGEQDGDDLPRLFVEELQDYAVVMIDEARQVLSWNRGAVRLLGYSEAEMIGQPIDRVFTPEDVGRGVPEAEAREALERGRAGDDRWHVRKDGRRVWVNGVMVRLRDGEGRVRGLAKILRDQTSLRRAEEGRDLAEEALALSETRFRLLIEANIIGVGILAASGEWIEANDALLSLLGSNRDDLAAGKVRWDELTPERDRVRDERAFAEAEDKGACTPYEKEYLLPDGEPVPVLTGFAKVTGFEGHYIAFVLDLRAQKRVERRLREADRRKDEFLAMLAHELRNPLSAIGNAVQVARRSDSPEQLEWAKGVIGKHVESLARMIDDLLDVSRITRGKIELRKQSVGALAVVSQAVETVRPLVEGRGHELIVSHSSSPMWVDGDPHRLEQVVVNLLSNAAKYTPTGGQIDLSCLRQKDSVVIRVRDNGAGIEPGAIPRMFELFAQGDRSAARSEGGLGIGLTLVKSLVEMHGGSVAARSDGPGTGSEFTVRLPAIAPPEPGAAPVAPAESPGRNGRIEGGTRVLVVDDNVDTARGLVQLLELLGLRVESAFDGYEAIDRARQFRPDYILLDIGLPGLTGYEVAEILRHDEACAGATFIAISGYGEAEAKTRSRAAGFDHHLVKPLDYDKLVSLISGE